MLPEVNIIEQLDVVHYCPVFTRRMGGAYLLAAGARSRA